MCVASEKGPAPEAETTRNTSCGHKKVDFSHFRDPENAANGVQNGIVEIGATLPRGAELPGIPRSCGIQADTGSKMAKVHKKH